MRYKTVLVDDEFHSTEILETLLQKSCPQIDIVAKFNQSKEALVFLQNNDCDLVFLDIEMPFLNGFELMEELGKTKALPNIIFVTAYDKYAMRAFKFAAFDYVLKPASAGDIEEAVKRFETHLKLDQTEKWEYLKSLFQAQNNFDKIVLSVQEGYEIVEIKDIIHIDADSNYSQVFIEHRKPIYISRTLKDFETTLKEKGFLRVHNSHLVNLSKIVRFIKADGGYVEMCNGKKLSVSKSKREELNNFFAGLM